MNSRYSRMTALDYENRAPSRRAEEIDSEVVEGMRCRRCGGPMRYEPWVRAEPYAGRDRYIAYAVCEICGRAETF